MEWRFTHNEREQTQTYTFTLSRADLQSLGTLSEEDSFALRYFGQSDDAEAKLMGLQIVARHLEAMSREQQPQPKEET